MVTKKQIKQKETENNSQFFYEGINKMCDEAKQHPELKGACMVTISDDDIRVRLSKKTEILELIEMSRAFLFSVSQIACANPKMREEFEKIWNEAERTKMFEGWQ